MSQDAPTPPLTLSDPVDEETRKFLGTLENDRAALSMQLGDLKVEEVRITRGLVQIDNERQRVFNEILQSRGLQPGRDQVAIDVKTGALSLLSNGPTPQESGRQA